MFGASGAAAFATEPNKIVMFFVVFLGVFLHWVYEVAVDVIKASGAMPALPLPLIVARVIVSFVGAAIAFIAIFDQASKANDGFKYFTAFTLGLAVDGLTAPWAS